ncbi:hypothetical protein GGQ92_002286 [Gracilibacillus halotolerans]|uniref:Uncharacterized protein n=1 Tax=Gracilibacillus halotolerans TaxID=74386 RepID=A0A841RRA9_9BACI|nr:hypothetical protein [Gracilibacillus halotolerans]MBB6513474.1 hypothetical protein [Gracilibacillus halotolerans]
MKKKTWYLITVTLFLIAACGTTNEPTSIENTVSKDVVEDDINEEKDNTNSSIPSNYDIQQIILETNNKQEMDVIDFAINDFSLDKIDVTLEERRNENGEFIILDVQYQLTREDNNWVVADIIESEPNVAIRRQVSDTINEQFFNGELKPHTDEISLVNFFDTDIPQVLTIQLENEKSVVRVFNLNEETKNWNKIYEDDSHDTYGGPNSLMVFDSAPLVEDSMNEQAIIGFQHGGSAISLYFHILSENNGEIDTIFDGMDLGARGIVGIENQDIVITDYDFDFDKDIELARFRINQNGELIYGDYMWGFPVREEASTTYTNDRFGFSINLPESFAQKFIVRETTPEWFTRDLTNVPVTMYAFGMGNNGEFVGNIFWLAVFEGNQSEIDPSLLEGPFHQTIGSNNNLTLVAIFPGEMDERLYQEPHLDLGNEFGELASDALTSLPGSVQFK